MGSDAFHQKVKRNVADHFDQSYQIYQNFEEKHGFFADLAHKLADTIELKHHASVLDVGCGNGISARVLYEQFACKVLGVDLSPKMVAAGRRLCPQPDVRLVVGDGEDLLKVASGQTFDYVLYNASIFIFPDVSRSIDGAFQCLRPGGKIAFSFYPELIDVQMNDLLAVAFRQSGLPMPRYRVITDYSKAAQVLSRCFGNIHHHRWERPLSIEFLHDFFTIPAQSASLFPGLSYEQRCDSVRRLFDTLNDKEETGRIVWRMAHSVKQPLPDDGVDRMG